MKFMVVVTDPDSQIIYEFDDYRSASDEFFRIYNSAQNMDPGYEKIEQVLICEVINTLTEEKEKHARKKNEEQSEEYKKDKTRALEIIVDAYLDLYVNMAMNHGSNIGGEFVEAEPADEEELEDWFHEEIGRYPHESESHMLYALLAGGRLEDLYNTAEEIIRDIDVLIDIPMSDQRREEILEMAERRGWLADVQR